jgi:hypothetical protein
MNDHARPSLPIDLHRLTADEAAMLLFMVDDGSADDSADTEMPAFDLPLAPSPESSLRITRNVVQTIRRGDLGSDILEFSTGALASSFMALITPLLNNPERRRVDRRNAARKKK